jgi:hypothetical protein
MTGIVESASTRTVWLPSTAAARPRRPRDDIAIRSQPAAAAVRRIARCGSSAVSFTSVDATPAAPATASHAASTSPACCTLDAS